MTVGLAVAVAVARADYPMVICQQCLLINWLLLFLQYSIHGPILLMTKQHKTPLHNVLCSGILLAWLFAALNDMPCFIESVVRWHD